MPLSDPTLYPTIVGSLVYLTIAHSNIAYVVHIVNQFVASPTTVHWATVLRILQYLRGIVFQSLQFSSTSTSYLKLYAYSDVDYGSDPTISNMLLVSVSFWIILLFLRRVIRNPFFLYLQPKRNIVL